MIERVNERLMAWAEQCVGGFSRPSGSILGAMIDCPPVASTRQRRRMIRDELGSRPAPESAHGTPTHVSAHRVVKVSDQVMDTSKAVASLPENLREVVNVFYFDGALAVEVRARKLKVSKKTLYRRLDAAHVLIDSKLYGTELPKIS